MLTATTEASTLGTLGRLDAWYYLAPGAASARRLDIAKSAGLETRRIGGETGLGRAWMPGRLKQVTAGESEPSLPYIKPHDVFQYLPEAQAELSRGRTPAMTSYQVRRGLILQTRSGRNLGPNALVDRYLERFVVSDDLIRVDIPDSRMRNFTTAFLRSRTGQGLLRRDKSGSVIDHLSPQQVEAQEIPLLDDPLIDQVADLIAESFRLVEEARETLSKTLATYEQTIPGPPRKTPPKVGWTVPVAQLFARLDAAPFEPWIREIQEELLAAGGCRVRDVATVLKPPGRYKTIYVGEEFGRPFMSGTQILQLVPAKPQFMAIRAFNDPALYELRKGWSVYMADGRAEKNLGVVAMIPSDRAGWLASGHVGRLVPKPGTNPGFLWLAARTWQVQAQIKAVASGSVVDSSYPVDMDEVVLPPATAADGPTVCAAWEKFAEARAAEAKAIELVDAALAELSGVHDEELVDEADPAPDASSEVPED